MREVVAVRRLFLITFQVLFFSLRVGPLDRATPLMAQTTRPDGVYIFYMARIINIHIFSILNQKSEKMNYAQWQL